MKNILYILFLLSISTGMAQEQLNDYKYIIVPKQFDDFKRENQYQTSTLIKFLLTENGFNAVWEDEVSAELANNRCLGLRAKLIDGSSMFTTKASVLFENCNGQEVFTTKEGKSKKKDYKDSFGEALRKAFTSFDGMDYSYNGKTSKTGQVTVSMQNDIKQLDKENAKQTQSNANRSPLVEQKATRENQRYVDRRPRESDLKKAVIKDGVDDYGAGVKGNGSNSAAKGRESYKDGDPAASGSRQTNAVEANASMRQESMAGEESIDGEGGMAGQESIDSERGMAGQGNATGQGATANRGASVNQENPAQLSDIASATLYAQELPNGYQLVDSTPKIRLKIQKTSMPDFYLAEAGRTNGVVFQKNGAWFLEYYEGDKLMSKELNIKF